MLFPILYGVGCAFRVWYLLITVTVYSGLTDLSSGLTAFLRFAQFQAAKLVHLAGVNDGLMVCCQVIGLYGVVYDARMIVMCCQVLHLDSVPLYRKIQHRVEN